jgi:hypothetical protein
MLSLARLLITFGLVLLVMGGLLYLFARLDLPLGRLPGDIRIERENFSCVFPLMTMILISIVLTVLLNLILRWLNR